MAIPRPRAHDVAPVNERSAILRAALAAGHIVHLGTRARHGRWRPHPEKAVAIIPYRGVGLAVVRSGYGPGAVATGPAHNFVRILTTPLEGPDVGTVMISVAHRDDLHLTPRGSLAYMDLLSDRTVRIPLEPSAFAERDVWASRWRDAMRRLHRSGEDQPLPTEKMEVLRDLEDRLYYLGPGRTQHVSSFIALDTLAPGRAPQTTDAFAVRCNPDNSVSIFTPDGVVRTAPVIERDISAPHARGPLHCEFAERVFALGGRRTPFGYHLAAPTERNPDPGFGRR